MKSYAAPVVVGVEVSDDYHRAFAWGLTEAGFEMRLISSLLHNGWGRNDPKDARVILHMLKVGAVQRYCSL